MSSPALKKVDDLNQRFIQVMEALGDTGYSLSRKLDTSEAVISNVRLGKNPPNINLVRGLLKEYKEVDPEWLLLGAGRMLRSQNGTSPTSITSGLESERIERKLDEVLRVLKRSVEIQMERNVMIDESISELQQQVEGLIGLQAKTRNPRKEG